MACSILLSIATGIGAVEEAAVVPFVTPVVVAGVIVLLVLTINLYKKRNEKSVKNRFLEKIFWFF